VPVAALKLLSSADNIYHATVMPCYDKKLEASRDDFYNDIFRTRDVDCVLTSGEIIDIIKEKAIDFVQLEESVIDPLFTNISAEGQLFGISGGAGGYLEYIFKYAAKELFNVVVDKIEYKTTRNADLKTTTLEVGGTPVLTFVAAYGFKNIQNVVRKMQSKTLNVPYHFVEIMACPSACLNGGGQIRPQTGETAKQLLRRVEQVYNEQQPCDPEQNNAAQQLYKLWFNGVFTVDALTNLHTQYHEREKIATNPLLIRW